MKISPQTNEEIERIRRDVYEENWELWKEEDDRQLEKIDKYIYED